MMTNLEIVQQKIYTLEALNNEVNAWKQQQLKVAFTNGCFDLVHAGHITYLAAAADSSDKLVVGLNADHSLQRLKGTDRPIIEQYNRALLLASLQFIDAIVIFNEDTPINVIKKLMPDILIKGGDYTVDQIVGAKEVRSAGGTVKIIPYLTGLSTTNIIAKIKQVEL